MSELLWDIAVNVGLPWLLLWAAMRFAPRPKP